MNDIIKLENRHSFRAYDVIISEHRLESLRRRNLYAEAVCVCAMKNA